MLVAGGVYLASSVAIAAWLMPTGREAPPVSFAPPRDKPVWGKETPAHLRTLALRQARVWMPANPAVVDFEANPPDSNGLLSQPIVRCRYLDGPVRGTTPKFDCVLPDGEVVKVKYGRNAEIHAELAATRLLAALGFGADRMLPRSPPALLRLRSHAVLRGAGVRLRPRARGGEPQRPGGQLHRLRMGRGRAPPRRRGDRSRATKTAGRGTSSIRSIRRAAPTGPSAMRSASRRCCSRTGTTRRRTSGCCACRRRSPGAACTQPFAYAHDLGATFGPKKVDFEQWRGTPVWADASQCLLSMRQFPYSGGTFPDARISEAGRQLLVRQLSALTERHLVALFTGARFPEFNGRGSEVGDASAWARALLDKAHQIASAGPCAE